LIAADAGRRSPPPAPFDCRHPSCIRVTTAAAMSAAPFDRRVHCSLITAARPAAASALHGLHGGGNT